MKLWLRRALVAAPLGLFLFAATPATVAHAGNDPAGAQALFTEGKRLANEGRYSDACPKFEESQRLDPGMGTLFQLASCHQHIGKTATAWAEYLDVAGQAKALGQKDREKVAREKAAAIESQVSKVVIATRLRGADSVSGLEIKRDGVDVGRGQWGMALPIDPGEHKIVATAPGKKRWETTIRVVSDGKTTTVEVPVLEDAPKVAVVAPPPSTVMPDARAQGMQNTQGGAVVVQPSEMTPNGPSSTTITTSGTDVDTNRGSGQRTAGVVIAIVGVAGLATGTVFGLQSKSKHDDASSHCNGNVCDATGAQLRDDARRDGNISTIAFGAGAAALVGGVVLYLTAPSAQTSTITTSTQARRVQAAPLIGNGVSGLTLRGAF